MISRFYTRAFSLAELLVAVAIMTILSAGGFSAFSLLASNEEASLIQKRITALVRNFDESIERGDIGSYEMIFEKNANRIVVHTDFIGSEATGSLVLNWNSQTGSYIGTSSTGGIWKVAFLENKKYINVKIASGSIANFSFSLSPPKNEEYKISTTFGYKNIDLFYLYSLSPSGLSDIKSNWFINSLWYEDNYLSGSILNISGKKVFSINSSATGSLFLEFSNQGKTTSLTLQ